MSRRRPSGRWLAQIAVAVVALSLTVAVVWQPPPVQRAEHWLHYRLTGYVPPPIVVGRNGRMFLGNHEGSPPNSLIRDVCGDGVTDAAIARSAALIRAVLAAGHATGLPFRFLIIPTAPRIYPEDLPAGTPCAQPAADRVVTALGDPAVDYPAGLMQGLKTRFDVLPRRHFHWAGEGPLRVAEDAADQMGLHQTTTLSLRPDNRSSDLNGFYPGLGLHDRIGTPNLKTAGVTQCAGVRCDPPLSEAIAAFTRPGPGRLLILADSFGDEVAGDFSEYAGLVWLIRMNIALGTQAAPLSAAISQFRPDALLVAYHDAGALALDPASQASLALAATLISDARLRRPPANP